MNRDWMASFEALKDVYIDGAYSNMAVNEAILKHRGCQDSFVRNMVKGVLRRSLTLDAVIDRLAARGAASIKPRTMIILRMGIYAADELDSVPDHAAVNEAVSLARLAARGTDRFVNAVLRSYLRRRDELTVQRIAEEAADPDERLGILYSFRPGMVRLIRSQYGDETEKILAGLNDQPPLVLRANVLKNTAAELADMLRDEGFSVSEAAARALIVSGSRVLDSPLYAEGRFSVQSLSSMQAIEALAPVPGSRVLDMCAAPGGKAAMMAEMMGGAGSITACDIHSHRLALIESAASRLGIDIIETRLMDGTVHDSSLDESYDFVLADVPCSGLGEMGTKPEIRLRAETDPEAQAALTGVQRAILRNALRYVRPGGRVCYSTCTINRLENEQVVTSELQSVRFVRIVEMRDILPYNNLHGFFYCIMEKLPL